MPNALIPLLDDLRPTFPRGVEQLRESFRFASGNWANVKSFGALGNGIVDDTAAFLEAKSFVNSVSSSGTPGGVIFVPPGDFIVDNAVLDGNNICLLGSGYSSRIINPNTNGYSITMGDGTTTYNRCVVANLGFGQKAGVTPVGGGGLRIRKLIRSICYNLYMPSFPGPLFNGIRVQDGDAGTKFILCRVGGALNIGFDAFDTLDVTLIECKLQVSGVIGIKLDACEGAQSFFTESGLGQPTAWYITDSGGGSRISQNHKHVGSVGDNSLTHNWHIDKLIRGRFYGCWGGTTTVGTGNNFLFDGSAAPNVDIKSIIMEGCRSIGAQGHGVSAIGVQGLNIGGGCQSNTNGQAGAFSGYAGFHFDDCNRLTVVGVSATFFQDYGISLTGTACSNALIGPNNLSGNGVAGFNEGVFPTASRVKDNVSTDAVPSLVSAATLPQVPARMDLVQVTLTNQIDHIPGDYDERIITLLFKTAGGINVNHNVAGPNKVLLRGGALKTFQLNETLRLVSFGGDWYEI